MRLKADDRIRKSIAHAAAKIVAQEGLENFLLAKKKAAQHLNISNKRLLPSNSEIEDALIEYQSLFHHEEQTELIMHFRDTAYKAMLLLKDFKPLLTGSVLSGTANKNSEIIIHVFAEASELISLFLESKRIPFTLCERRLKPEKKNAVYFNAIKFIAGDTTIVVIVLPQTLSKNAPIDPITQRPMRRANLHDVKKLIDAH